MYPPKNIAGLRMLVTTIEEKDELDRLKKVSFFYYLLKDFDHANPGNGFASHYASKALIQPNFRSLMDGLYAMDNFEFEVRSTSSSVTTTYWQSIQTAIRHLTEPSVTPVNPHKILSTLISRAGPSHGPRLATIFVQTTQPVLDTDSSIRDYFSALESISVESAFTYQRTVPSHLQLELFKNLIDYCLTAQRESNALKLINLPFTPEEQVVFESHIRDSNIPTAQDTLIIRQMHQGHLNEALIAAKSAQYQSEILLEGVNWASLAGGLSLGTGHREE